MTILPGQFLPNRDVLSGGAQLLNGPTQYLTRQRLLMACVKLSSAVFVFLFCLARRFHRRC